MSSTTLADFYATSNGAAWAPERELLPSGASSAELLGVSCVSPTFCVAVGDFGFGRDALEPLAEHWNGSRWTQENVPTPLSGSASVSILYSVSCPDADSCFVVGGDENGPFAEHWDGHTWTLQTVTGLTHSGSLTGVSCVSATSCIAVGSYPTGSGTDEAPLVASLAGSVWNVSGTAGPSGATSSSLAQVSCTASASCFAVGFDVNGTDKHPFISHWNGSTWRQQVAPVPPGTSSGALSSVSCSSAMACTAVGSYQSPSLSTALADRWNGSSWVLQPVTGAAGANTDNDLGVSCPTNLACTAVGATFNPDALSTAAEWGGPAWAALAIPSPPTMKSADLFATSCPTANWCVAVGQYDRSSDGRLVPFAEYWNGSSWRILPDVTLPDAAGSATLLAVSCPVVDGCVAVGGYDHSSDGVLVPLLVSWNGSAWGAISSAAVGTYAQLEGVSCTTIHACEAVGLTIPSARSGISAPLAETVNGTSATVQRVPAPPQNDGGALHGVSCDASLNCIAVGNWDEEHGEMALAYRLLAGGPWTRMINPNAGPRADAGEDDLFGVSCLTFTSCLAAGAVQLATETPLAQQLSGTTWTDVSPGRPGQSAFKAVSCPAANACTALGYHTTSSQTLTLAERWDGTRWSTQTTPSPSGDNILYGIACTTPDVCIAVGTIADNHTPLAEIYS